MEEEKSQSNDWSRHNRPRPFMAIILIVGIFAVIGLVFAANNRGRRVGTVGNGFGGHARMAKQGQFPARFGGGKTGMAGHRSNLGSISVINGNSFTLHASSGDTNVTITSTTSIYNNGVVAKQADLKVGDVVSVFGQPGSDGTIQARLIQIN